ncbi:MAG: hypothetical protein KME05_00385 [Gloeocapsa sp. UFS-A4-WI-NPMV-4B04]|jgi:hypothetical protein|nr:hypothetical protein [Gloeocapsa sp. UFS-A4-WI-NPMV-4B04]
MAGKKGCGGRKKGIAQGDYGELKMFKTFRLTPTAVTHLDKLRTIHGYRSRTEVIESMARPDGDLIALPRHILDIWLQESKDKTSPRWQRAQELLEELKEYLPRGQ